MCARWLQPWPIVHCTERKQVAFQLSSYRAVWWRTIHRPELCPLVVLLVFAVPREAAAAARNRRGSCGPYSRRCAL